MNIPKLAKELRTICPSLTWADALRIAWHCYYEVLHYLHSHGELIEGGKNGKRSNIQS